MYGRRSAWSIHASHSARSSWRPPSSGPTARSSRRCATSSGPTPRTCTPSPVGAPPSSTRTTWPCRSSGPRWRATALPGRRSWNRAWIRTPSSCGTATTGPSPTPRWRSGSRRRCTTGPIIGARSAPSSRRSAWNRRPSISGTSANRKAASSRSHPRPEERSEPSGPGRAADRPGVAHLTDSPGRKDETMDIPQERKVLTEIPGPKSREWFERRKAAIPQAVFNVHPIVTARASGSIIEDVDGNRLIDFATGISVLNVGHTPPEVVAAAQKQLELDTHTCFHVTANEPYIELAERLNALAPGEFDKRTMFANSGAEAVENAVKIARKATGRSAVVTFDHAFHGRTLLAMSLTAKVMPYKQGMGPFAPEIYRLPFAYAYRWPSGPEHCAEEALAYARDEMHKQIGEENIAAVIVEPIQGEGGFIVPAPGFLTGLADLCREHGIVFISDEIQSGMGRAGRGC